MSSTQNHTHMENELTLKEKYLLTKEHPGLFYLQFFNSVEVHFDHKPILVSVKKAMILGNN